MTSKRPDLTSFDVVLDAYYPRDENGKHYLPASSPMSDGFLGKLKSSKGPWVMPVAIQDSQLEHGAMMAPFLRMRSARNSAMEEFVKIAMSIGYVVSDMLIETLAGIWNIDEPRVERDRLVIRGKAYFEVKTTTMPFVDFKTTITVEPQIIAWPPLAEVSSGMTMVPRDPITIEQINAAKGKVDNGDGPEGAEDTDAVAQAEMPTKDSKGAPGKLPVYR